MWDRAKHSEADKLIGGASSLSSVVRGEGQAECALVTTVVSIPFGRLSRISQSLCLACSLIVDTKGAGHEQT